MTKNRSRFNRIDKGKSANALAKEAYSVKPEDIEFEEEPTTEGGTFYSSAVCLYGQVKIGKSTFASLLDKVYFLPTEVGYSWLNVRKTFIPNWASFKKFVQLVEKKPKLVRTVNMWCIDTTSNLSKFCTQYVCGREDIRHPSDQKWGKGWEAIADEFSHWILRLAILGPGILFICHEKEREIISHSAKITKKGPDLIKSHYNIVNQMCDLILNMDFQSHNVKKQKKSFKKSGNQDTIVVDRCIFTKPSDEREAGDRTGLGLPEKILFRTEQEVVKTLLGFFE